MFYTLTNNKTEIKLPVAIYEDILNLAVVFDWQPLGTQAPKIPGYKWPGAYLGNTPLKVVKEDAENIRKALREAILFIKMYQDLTDTGIEPKDQRLDKEDIIYYIEKKTEIKEYYNFLKYGEYYTIQL
jgi:hypothetical protein